MRVANVGSQFERPGDVGEWPERHEREFTGVLVRCPDQLVDRIAGVGGASGERGGRCRPSRRRRARSVPSRAGIAGSGAAGMDGTSGRRRAPGCTARSAPPCRAARCRRRPRSRRRRCQGAEARDHRARQHRRMPCRCRCRTDGEPSGHRSAGARRALRRTLGAPTTVPEQIGLTSTGGRESDLISFRRTRTQEPPTRRSVLTTHPPTVDAASRGRATTGGRFLSPARSEETDRTGKR